MEETLTRLLAEIDIVSPIDKLRNVYEHATGSAYTVDSKGNICSVRTLRDGGETLEPIADFCIEPRETVQKDDGLEQTLEYGLTGYDYRGRQLPLVRVPANKFSAFSWVTESWPGAVIRAGQTKKDRLRECVQMVERETATRRTVYSHSGWRKINGKWCFLYHGGAIGCDGCSVELPDKLARYNLSIPNKAVSTSEALRASLQLLELAPYSVTVPLLATMYAAPLVHWFDVAKYPIVHTLWLIGRTQSKKSTLAALFLTHFGRDFTYQTLPGNFHSTANYIATQMFLTADAPLVVDDFHPSPTGRANSRDTMTQIAEDITRGWADHAARGRMESDGTTMKSARPARGLGVITAEYMPDFSASSIARGYAVELSPNSVQDLRVLSAAQQMGEDGVYVVAMRAYIEWLTRRVGTEAFDALLKERFTAARSHINSLSNAYVDFGRLATSGAHIITAFSVFVDCLIEHGVLSETEADILLKRAFESIANTLSTHGKTVAQNDPMRIFAECVQNLRNTSDAFVYPHAGTYIAKDVIGFQTEDSLYIFPGKCYNAVRDMCIKSGSDFPISKAALWKRLFEAGYILSKDAENKRVPPGGIQAYYYKMPINKFEQLLGGDTNSACTSTDDDYPY